MQLGCGVLAAQIWVDDKNRASLSRNHLSAAAFRQSMDHRAWSSVLAWAQEAKRGRQRTAPLKSRSATSEPLWRGIESRRRIIAFNMNGRC